jgi:hypothetical protein
MSSTCERCAIWWEKRRETLKCLRCVVDKLGRTKHCSLKPLVKDETDGAAERTRGVCRKEVTPPRPRLSEGSRRFPRLAASDGDWLLQSMTGTPNRRTKPLRESSLNVQPQAVH